MALKVVMDPKVKKPWTSKTMVVSAITAVLPLVCPPLAVWVSANPEMFASSLGLIFLGLRLVTNGKVTIE